MQLFSTIIDISETLTPDLFIKLVLEWNETSIYAENRVTGVIWEGERSVRYGDANLWLEFIEDSNRNILAVRHEKVTSDGVVWDSDFVMNFAEHKMAIQLDRTYSEDALVMDARFSTPHFISLLIEHGYVKGDQELPVLRTPIYVTDQDLELCRKIFSEEENYELPVIFVFKTETDEFPLSLEWLASRLKGAAHVVAEEVESQCHEIRSLCKCPGWPYGAVHIYYPSDSVRTKKTVYRSSGANGELRLENVIRNVIQYGNAQRIEELYTWQGVVGAVLNDRLQHQMEIRISAETAKQKAEEEIGQVYEAFDEDLRILQEKVAALTKANEALRTENQGLRAKYSYSQNVPLLYQGEEEEFYDGEIRDIILEILDTARSSVEDATRKADLLDDILEMNPFKHLSEERRKRIKALFKGYKSVSASMRQELLDMGFEIEEAGKHYKLTYSGDQRYMVTVGKTPSDNRSGDNNAAMICKIML